MDIIHRGTPPSEVWHYGKCNSCKSSWRFKKHEATLRCDQRDGNSFEMKCPVCDTQLSIDYNASLRVIHKTVQGSDYHG